MEELNLVEKLKNAPKGLKLYSPIYGEVRFENIETDSIYPIQTTVGCDKYNFSLKGKYANLKDAECMLFPSRNIRDWSRFQIPKIGDTIEIEHKQFKVKHLKYAGFYCENYDPHVSYFYDFKIIEQPKFKVGDIVIAKNKPCEIVEYDNENHYYVCCSPYPCDTCVKIEDIRPTTKQELRDKYNLMLDENKNLVRWMPKKEDIYYFVVNPDSTSKTSNHENPSDRFRINHFNCFPTEEMAKQVVRRMEKIFKNYTPK